VRDTIIKFCKWNNAILGAQTMKIFYTIPWAKVVVPVATVKSFVKCLVPSGSWKEWLWLTCVTVMHLWAPYFWLTKAQLKVFLCEISTCLKR
jgi:hypothetical protein